MEQGAAEACSADACKPLALRLIVARELEIRAFVAEEYWTIHALLDAGQPPLFEAKLLEILRARISKSPIARRRIKLLAAVSEAEVAGDKCHAAGKEAQSSAAVYHF